MDEQVAATIPHNASLKRAKARLRFFWSHGTFLEAQESKLNKNCS